MCGITGLWYFDGQKVDPGTLGRISKTIVHRGPDNYHYWISDEAEIGFGHQRLSILDLSEKADQPMKYLGRYVITFNGEVYNYLEIKETLIKRGYSFHSTTDTEVVLAAYAEYGEKCLDHFNGMFAFAIYDLQEKTLFCARDRFGEKPFFYAYVRDKYFIFGSEIKVILEYLPQYQLEEELFFLFYVYQLHENPNNKKQTFFRDIHKLEASHCMKIDSQGNIRLRKYWEIQLGKEASSDDFRQAVGTFQDMLADSVSKRLRSDVPVGTSLSGGLDSSTIMHLILSQKDKQLAGFKSFTARFNSNRDEGKYINILAQKYNFRSYQKVVTEYSLINDMNKILWHQEQPFSSASPVAQWEVMKLANHNSMKVLLDGQGADEVLAGYLHYFRPYLAEIAMRNFALFFKEYRNYLSVHGAQGIINLTYFSELLIPQMRQVMGKIRRHATVPAHMKDMGPDFLRKYKTYDPPFYNFSNLNEALHYSTFTYGLEKLLTFADRNAMAFSVEVRLPFLDHKMVEYLFSLPADYKIHNGWTKYIQRMAFDTIIPEEITWRSEKVGFETPQDVWLQNPFLQQEIVNAKKNLQLAGFLHKPIPGKEWIYYISSGFLKTFGFI
jgi:asparagine synthase (glutamine-hydrolysing)